MEDKRFIGRIAVDSAKLLLIDPSYIEKHWKLEKDSKLLGLQFWGKNVRQAVKWMETCGWEVKMDEDQVAFIYTDDNSIFQDVQQDLIVFMSEPQNIRTINFNSFYESSMNQVETIVDSEELAGVLDNGIACALKSGFGDGEYDVYATYKDYGGAEWIDKRIKKVEIVFIDD